MADRLYIGIVAGAGADKVHGETAGGKSSPVSVDACSVRDDITGASGTAAEGVASYGEVSGGSLSVGVIDVLLGATDEVHVKSGEVAG